jgi:putative oxidoreductase
MRTMSVIARILLGLIFTVAGLAPVFVGSPPPMPGLAGVLNTALYQSHWMYAISLAQLIAGVLLLLNRYVPVGLLILAAFLYNSLAFHALLMPATLPVPMLVAVLWLIACLPYRKQFGALFWTPKQTGETSTQP